MSARKPDHNNTNELVNEINNLLSELRSRPAASQKGGNRDIVSEVNNLLSEIRGVQSNLSENEVMDLAMKGGAKKSKKSSSKTVKKAKKSKSASKPKAASKTVKKAAKKTTKSKSKSKTKSASKPSKKAVKATKASSKSKSHSKSQSKTPSKGRSMKRADGEDGEKKKRAPNQYIVDLTALRAYIKGKVPNENLNNVGAMSKAASVVLAKNNRDLEQAKKNFNASSFMRDYNTAKKEIEAKREAKKANKV